MIESHLVADNLTNKIPPDLKEAQRTGSLLVFAGAGVSQSSPSDLPGFDVFCERVRNYYGTGKKGFLEEPTDYLKNIRRFAQRDGKMTLNEFVQWTYSCPKSKPNDLHRLLLGLFDQNHGPRIVTTNYDMLFVDAAREIDRPLGICSNPNRPASMEFDGIYFPHGCVKEAPEHLIVTVDDFDKAYVGTADVLNSLRELSLATRFFFVAMD